MPSATIPNLEEIDVKRLHIALDTAGSISGAAALLGRSPSSLQKLVEKHPELQSYLKGATPPGDMEAFARKPLPKPDTTDPSDEEVAAAYKQAEKNLGQSLLAIGVRDRDRLAKIISLRDFGRMHFQSIREITGAGAFDLYLDTLVDIKKTRDQIEETDLANIDVQRMLREDRSRMVKHALETFDKIHQAGITAAMVEAKKREAKEAKKKRVPGFAPLTAMKVQGDVHIHEAKAPAPAKAQEPEVE